MGKHQHNRRDGFTLIELSIVLVIIGLIVGGILTGQALIRSATLKSAITDEQKYVTAVNTFRTKYNELPGDMVDATNVWGTDPTQCPNWGAYSMPQTTTCNGNGNGLIENDSTGGGYTAATNYENFRAWQQLANAHLISGGYTGTPGPIIVSQNIPGLNVPATRIPNGGFEWTTGNSIQYLLLGGAQTGGNADLWILLSPSDAQSIDLKLDDGMPTTGSVTGTGNDNNGNYCENYITLGYNTAISLPVCIMVFQVKSW